MLYSHVTPEAKRLKFRELLAEDRCVQFPGTFTPLATKVIQDKGFDGVYISGGVLANELGLPDVGLTTLTEVAQRGAQIARSTDLPTLIDADTGFGEPMNVARTIQELENAGVSGCHIEDQFNPKRCGHLDGKSVVDLETAVKRIQAGVQARRDPNFVIMARTDIRAIEPLEVAIERAQALVEAGADVIFPEALRDISEFEAVASAVSVPVLANMTEFGKSELFTVQQLQDAGVSMVIYPVSAQRAAMGAVERLLDTIKADGTQQAAVADMQTRARLYETVDYDGYGAFDSNVFNFEVPGGRS
ncbi:methylisocitrate lyase [Kocuria soli]|uniref:Methylisocitrate lyase n=1 Tax=Kocuria soli TaxID=2485125 RepID=A0A3N3ZVF1_9MICC|nr:methylisocitrate lyase [Kocuria soli]ROZ64071.1 methylisocitrate lyase [Kocuria soli]